MNTYALVLLSLIANSAIAQQAAFSDYIDCLEGLTRTADTKVLRVLRTVKDQELTQEFNAVVGVLDGKLVTFTPREAVELSTSSGQKSEAIVSSAIRSEKCVRQKDGKPCGTTPLAVNVSKVQPGSGFDFAVHANPDTLDVSTYKVDPDFLTLGGAKRIGSSSALLNRQLQMVEQTLRRKQKLDTKITDFPELQRSLPSCLTYMNEAEAELRGLDQDLKSRKISESQMQLTREALLRIQSFFPLVVTEPFKVTPIKAKSAR